MVHTFTPNDVRFIGWLTTLTSAAGLQYEDRALNQYSVIARGLFPNVGNINQGTPTLDMTKTLVRNQAAYLSEEILGFQFVCRGVETVREGSRQLALTAGDVVLWDGTQPTDVEIVESFYKRTLLFPRDRVLALCAVNLANSTAVTRFAHVA